MSNKISSLKDIDLPSSLKKLKLSLHFNPISSVEDLDEFNNKLISNNHGSISKFKDLRMGVLDQNKKKIIMESL